MAEIAKKLHFLKNGTEQTAKAYSTTDEAGSNYVPLKIDGVACYAPLGATNDAMATNGRVIKSGTTYAIKSQAKPPYAEVKYTTAGTHTFTVPTGVTRLQVAVCGGGGGGSKPTTADFSNYDQRQYFTGGTGGTSSFGSLIQATGGGGGSCYAMLDSDSYRVDVTRQTNGANGSPNGNSSGHGYGLSFTMATGTSYSYGKWGTGFGSGGSGGYNSNYVSVSANTTYTVKVGAGGTKSGSGATNGGSGFVFIAYGGDI